jgi:hypothetical protein
MDNVRHNLDKICQEEMVRLGIKDPARFRNAYIRVALGKISEEQFLNEQGVDVKNSDRQRALILAEAQYYRQCMYASCTYFFADLDAHTTRYGLASAAYAIKLTADATGMDLSPDFRADLAVATGQRLADGTLITGGQIYDEIVESFRPRS